MKGARITSTIAVFLLVMFAPMSAAGSDGCADAATVAVEAYQLASLQVEGQQIVLLDSVETDALDAFARATLQAEGQVMVAGDSPVANEAETATATYQRAVLQAEGQGFVELLAASCQP